MDVSPYLRKPLRSLQEVVDTLKPASSPETAAPDGAAASEHDGDLADLRDSSKP
jgi:hypothetical protein